MPPAAAASGAEARAVYSDEPFDLVLIDVHMPDEDGPEVTGDLLSDPGPHAVFVALTADTLPETTARCLSSGMKAVLAKPVCLEALSSLLAAISPRQGERSAQLAGPLPGALQNGEAAR